MPKIALIDDDPEEHLLIARQLRQIEKLSFQAFENCDDALHALEHAPPDILLIDANRAGFKSPLQTARELRDHGLTCPLVLVSNSPVRPKDLDGHAYSGFLQKDDITAQALAEYYDF